MADEVRTTPEPSMASLLIGIVNDTQTLVKQEVALARRELKDELMKTVQAAMSLAIGIGLMVIGGFFVLVGLVLLLAWAVPAVPLWGWFLIFGAVWLAIGGSLLYLAKTKAEDISLVPPQTAATMKENAQWLKNRT